jgi:hypothetical protein
MSYWSLCNIYWIQGVNLCDSPLAVAQVMEFSMNVWLWIFLFQSITAREFKIFEHLRFNHWWRREIFTYFKLVLTNPFRHVFRPSRFIRIHHCHKCSCL